ncbi:MAG: tRNA dihydrouridine synthase DusB [Gammaproteobacteria bacterium]|nr:tRNA dihydrouridine synthase DusB [Gammaproteobacteria bacterium]|tara:strand:- start:1850 stop:2791 length:942 start_codon:yes stop_codon:yes gene_type:complete
MAGVTDRPIRVLCRALGAGMAISEMIHSDTSLWGTKKSDRRLDIRDEPGPISIQIAGYDPKMMAKAARANEERGADIIDINLGCPAKKVLKKAAGSALMRDELLCAEIFRQVVSAVQIPVTVKMRTGWDHLSKNGPMIAKMAEDLGLQAVTMHGRTRCDMYKGDAEYDTIQRTREAVQIPLIANGDITSIQKAHEVLSATGADAVMIGRGTQGDPWLPGIIAAQLEGRSLSRPSIDVQIATMAKLIREIQLFYGEKTGVKMARKHMQWFLKRFANGREAWSHLYPIVDPDEQYQRFKELIDGGGLRDGTERTG